MHERVLSLYESKTSDALTQMGYEMQKGYVDGFVVLFVPTMPIDFER
jgi:hypothetical protein